jgi:endonuclease/exonuclease/phosphatase family metal-dependent hydrolase
VVSFNIAFARNVDAAAALLATHPELRGADVVLLQEMTGDATRRIAEALGHWWVYYPAIHHRRARRDFGNAVLTRWPIIDDAKLVLPHRSRYGGTQRIATAATVQVGDVAVRVYSTHLGTLADVGGAGRRAQLRAILADAAPHARVVVGGDMNDGTVGRVARDAGYAWPTAVGPRTTRLGRWDHVFFRGFAGGDAVAAAGTIVREARGISDHVPVWAVAPLR